MANTHTYKFTNMYAHLTQYTQSGHPKEHHHHHHHRRIYIYTLWIYIVYTVVLKSRVSSSHLTHLHRRSSSAKEANNFENIIFIRSAFLWFLISFRVCWALLARQYVRRWGGFTVYACVCVWIGLLFRVSDECFGFFLLFSYFPESVPRKYFF